MYAEKVFTRVSSILQEYLEYFHLGVRRGPYRVMRELTTGIVWTGSVQLTSAARLFSHTTNQLEAAVERMSQCLADRHWDHRELAMAVLVDQVREIDEDTLVPIDTTDLAKPYARCMEYQGIVRDASRPGDPLVRGYWCWGAYRFDPTAEVLAPLILRPYSTQEPDFHGENEVWDQAYHALRAATGGRGIWIQDRGGDRPSVLSTWLRIQPRWIIRLRGDRGLIGPDGSLRPAQAWADWALRQRTEHGHAVTLKVALPRDRIAQGPDPPPLWLVVPSYTSADGQSWLLLTCGLIDRHAGPRQIRHDYAFRWRAEDAKRFLGQVWHVEHFLVRSFVALQRTLLCVILAGHFLATLQRDYPHLSEQLQSQGLYWDKPYRIPAYRLARGLRFAACQAEQEAAMFN